MALCVAMLALAVFQPQPARATLLCDTPDERGIQQCKAGLEPARIRAMELTQDSPQWCWAAVISMVFTHHGYAVPQREIARRQFPDLADRRISGANMTEMLGQAWLTDSGQAFLAQATVADLLEKRYELTASAIVEELARGRPLILGAQAHTVVLVEVAFERFLRQDALRITGGSVVDPAPGQGVRPLRASELRPSYLAAVRVQPAWHLTAAPAAAAKR